MSLISRNAIIDSILNTYRQDLGNDYDQYRNHVFRVYNFAVSNVNTIQEAEALAIAAALHDLGIWTNNTFDYLAHSIDLAKRYSTANGLPPEKSLEIETIIGEHHKLGRVKSSTLAEIFRQADLVDLSLGLIRCGRKREEIKSIRKKFPNEGFHVSLLRLFLKNLIRNPLNPLPMYKL